MMAKESEVDRLRIRRKCLFSRSPYTKHSKEMTTNQDEGKYPQLVAFDLE